MLNPEKEDSLFWVKLGCSCLILEVDHYITLILRIEGLRARRDVIMIIGGLAPDSGEISIIKE